MNGNDFVQWPTDTEVTIKGDKGDEKGRIKDMSCEKSIEFTEIFISNT